MTYRTALWCLDNMHMGTAAVPLDYGSQLQLQGLGFRLEQVCVYTSYCDCLGMPRQSGRKRRKQKMEGKQSFEEHNIRKHKA